jgi:flagellar hook assembly protein FlgD
MAMRGTMQATLAPVTPPNSVEFNQLKVAKQDKAADMGEKPADLDFRTILQNSNSETGRDRLAKKSGDLSGAKTDEEFYRMLSEKNSPQRTPKNQLGKDDFLKLFIAQMQNQDPLAPDDATEMAAQMAQFNSLEQMMNVNTTLGQLLKSQDQGRAVQLINYVGKEIDVGSGLLKFDKSKLTKASFAIDTGVPAAKLEVRDGSGQLISQQDLGNLMPGEHNIKWNGKLKDGKDALPGIYNFQVVGETPDGGQISIPIKSRVKVTGVDLKDEGGSFYTELGKVQLKDITSVGAQGFADGGGEQSEAVLPPLPIDPGNQSSTQPELDQRTPSLEEQKKITEMLMPPGTTIQPSVQSDAEAASPIRSSGPQTAQAIEVPVPPNLIPQPSTSTQDAEPNS